MNLFFASKFLAFIPAGSIQKMLIIFLWGMLPGYRDKFSPHTRHGRVTRQFL